MFSVIKLSEMLLQFLHVYPHLLKNIFRVVLKGAKNKFFSIFVRVISIFFRSLVICFGALLFINILCYLQQK